MACPADWFSGGRGIFGQRASFFCASHPTFRLPRSPFCLSAEQATIGIVRRKRVSPQSIHHRTSGDVDRYYRTPLSVQSYDAFNALAARTAVHFFVSQAKKFGSPVLELGAGTGLISWEVAAAGFEIVAVDLSAPMLEQAEEKRAAYGRETGNRIEFIQADMVELALDRRFNLAILPGRSFQHLTTPQEQRATLTNIAEHLHPSGGLVMNLFDPDFLLCLPGARPPSEEHLAQDPASGRWFRRNFLARKTDPLRQIFTEAVRIDALDAHGHANEGEETEWSLRWSHQQEMHYLLELSGFTVEALYSDFIGSPPAYGQEQVWIARRGK